MKKAQIIIGSDFSDSSSLAIKIGLNWADKLNSDPLVLYSSSSGPDSDVVSLIAPEDKSKSKDLVDMLREELEKKLDNQMESITGKEVEKKVVFGHTIHRFLEVVESRNCKLLVLSKNSTERDSLILGSFAERVTRMVSCPVLIINDDRANNPKAVSFPFEFKGLSVDASQWAEILASTFYAKVIPIHIVEKHLNFIPRNLDEVEDLYEIDVETRQMLDKLQFMVGNGLVDQVYFFSSAHSDEKRELLSRLKSFDSDLIVMGSSAHKGVERLYLGSVCEFILRNTPSSVLVTKSFAI